MNQEGEKKTLGLAIASLVMGCLVLIPILGLLFSLLAIIFGGIALVKISNNAALYKGKGLAVSGIILGGVGFVIIPIIAILLAITIPSFLRAKENAKMHGQQTIAVNDEISVSSNENR